MRYTEDSEGSRKDFGKAFLNFLVQRYNILAT